MIETEFTKLHAALLALSPEPTGNPPHDDFYQLAIKYKQHSDNPGQLLAIAACCRGRLQRQSNTLPLDVLQAYERLARVASWRARQL